MRLQQSDHDPNQTTDSHKPTIQRVGSKTGRCARGGPVLFGVATPFTPFMRQSQARQVVCCMRCSESVACAAVSSAVHQVQVKVIRMFPLNEVHSSGAHARFAGRRRVRCYKTQHIKSSLSENVSKLAGPPSNIEGTLAVEAHTMPGSTAQCMSCWKLLTSLYAASGAGKRQQSRAHTLPHTSTHIPRQQPATQTTPCLPQPPPLECTWRECTRAAAHQTQQQAES